MKKNGFYIADLILILGNLFTACSKEETVAVVENTETEPVYAVTVTNVLKGELKDYLEFGGDVSAKTQIDVCQMP